MLDFVPVLLCHLLDDANLQDLIRFQCRVPIDPIYYSIDFPLVLRLTCWRPFSKHIWQLKLELEMIKYRPVYGSGNLFFSILLHLLHFSFPLLYEIRFFPPNKKNYQQSTFEECKDRSRSASSTSRAASSLSPFSSSLRNKKMKIKDV